MAQENKLIRWANDRFPPIDLNNEVKPLIELIGKVKELEELVAKWMQKCADEQGKYREEKERNKVLEDALQPFNKLADAVFADTLKTNESPLYGYNEAVIFVRDLTAVKEALSNNQINY